MTQFLVHTPKTYSHLIDNDSEDKKAKDTKNA